VALSYRAILEKLAPQACNELDEQMVEYGQRWVIPQVVTYHDDDLLTAEQVADYCDSVNVKTVYVWRRDRGLPSVVTRDGIRFRFADLRAWRAR
jgi:hypothetical protein